MDALNTQVQLQLDSGLLQSQLSRQSQQLKSLSGLKSGVENGNITGDLKTGGAMTKAEKLKKLEKAAQEFEAIFFQQLLDAMDKTVHREDSMFNGGQGEQTFRGMLNQEISKSIASRPGGSGFGLANTIYKQMSRQVDAEVDRETLNSTIRRVDAQG